MHPQRVRAGGEHAVRQRVERHFNILLVNAEPALDRDRNRDRRLHGQDALRHQFWLFHQASAECAALHAVGRAADIHVDLAIAELLADPRRLRHLHRVRTAELQGNGLLLRRKAEQPFPRPVQDRVGDHHLCVEQRMARQLAVEEPAVPVRPVHHGCYSEHLAARHWRCRIVGHGSRLAGRSALLNR